MEGRRILEALKYVAHLGAKSTIGEIIDLFMQGYGLVVDVTSEVKFFETKLAHFAPSIPIIDVSDVRRYNTA